MTYEEAAGPWPFLARLAAMKGEGRGRGGRHSHIDHLERLAALREMRGGPWGRGFGPGPGGPFGGGRGRRRRGDVRTAILMPLAETPRALYRILAQDETDQGTEV